MSTRGSTPGFPRWKSKPGPGPAGGGAGGRRAVGPLIAAVAGAAALTACGAGERARSSPSARAQEVRRAVLAAPEQYREGARVLGYDRAGELVTLREGSGESPLTCLADDPREEGFRVACYHEDLGPFMRRGRELRARGVTGDSVDEVRTAEVEAGELPFPEHPVALYNLGAASPPDLPAGDELPGAQRLTVLYVRGGTGQETGLPTSPQGSMPWLMMAGTPKAHVMISH